MKKFLSIFILALLVLPLGVSAIPEPKNIQLPTVLTTTDDLFTFVRIALNWIFYALLVLAVVYILIIAIDYVTSGGGGGSDKVKANGQRLTYVLLGVALALLAKGLLYLVCYLLAGASTSCKF